MSNRLVIVAAFAILLLSSIVPAAVGKVEKNVTTPGAYVTASRLNVRAGPSTDFSVISTVNRRESLEPVGRNEDASWIQVNLPGGVKGWANTEYLAIDGPVDRLSVTYNSAALPIQPRLTLSDGVFSPGKSVTVLAEGFRANEQVSAFLYSSETGARQQLGTDVTDASGAAQLDVVIPSTWGSGELITQTNLLLLVGSADGQAKETAAVQYIVGRELTAVPPVIDETFAALRNGNLQAAREHLQGTALDRANISDGEIFYNLTGIQKSASEMTGIGTRVVDVRGDSIKAQTVLIFGDIYYRLNSEVVRVDGKYILQDVYVTGIFTVQDTEVVG